MACISITTAGLWGLIGPGSSMPGYEPTPSDYWWHRQGMWTNPGSQVIRHGRQFSARLPSRHGENRSKLFLLRQVGMVRFVRALFPYALDHRRRSRTFNIGLIPVPDAITMIRGESYRIWTNTLACCKQTRPETCAFAISGWVRSLFGTSSRDDLRFRW